jgi:DNA-binding winged helix-turn-helix (wHTH) protein/transposase-like protein
MSAAALCQKQIRDVSLPRTKTTAGELPPPDTKRWTARRKASVVDAIHSSIITIEEVCRRYALSVEEFLSWHNAIQGHGVQGLQTTKSRISAVTARTRAETPQTLPPSMLHEVGGLSEQSTCRRRGDVQCRRDTQSGRNHQSRIRTGDLVVNLETRVVSVDEKPVRLSRKEYSIVELLSLRQGVTVSKEMFLGHLYGGTNEPSLKIIDVFVCHLRKKLAQATGGKHYIATVWGGGYMLRDPAATAAIQTPRRPA